MNSRQNTCGLHGALQIAALVWDPAACGAWVVLQWWGRTDGELEMQDPRWGAVRRPAWRVAVGAARDRCVPPHAAARAVLCAKCDIHTVCEVHTLISMERESGKKHTLHSFSRKLRDRR